MTTDDTPTTPLLLDMEAAARRLGIDKSALDNLHRIRQLRGFQVGKKRYWRDADLVQFVNRLEPEK